MFSFAVTKHVKIGVSQFHTFLNKPRKWKSNKFMSFYDMMKKIYENDTHRMFIGWKGMDFGY